MADKRSSGSKYGLNKVQSLRNYGKEGLKLDVFNPKSDLMDLIGDYGKSSKKGYDLMKEQDKYYNNPNLDYLDRRLQDSFNDFPFRPVDGSFKRCGFIDNEKDYGSIGNMSLAA